MSTFVLVLVVSDGSIDSHVEEPGTVSGLF
jgi:hypothetical protein